MPNFMHERLCGGRVAGIDEAGRGPLAGPVVAAAVMFTVFKLPRALSGLLDDSKRLTPEARDTAFAALRTQSLQGHLVIGIGAASVGEIDQINILQASFLAMRRAVARLPAPPDSVLVDGNQVPPGLACTVRTLVGADGLSLSVAAASIIAKVVRDRAMTRLANRYPDFGWDTNVGYGTPPHLQGLAQRGPTRHHRLSFAPCAQSRLPL
jgi:ribonuclease HII